MCSPAVRGRVKLEDEALDFRVSMAEIERLSERTTWIDLSFVERDRTPRWAIEVGIRCHLAGMSLREVNKFLVVVETDFPNAYGSSLARSKI
jgi:hypothetical protein